MYKITFFVPETHVDAVKDAVFSTGAGKVGNYDCCSWQVLGQGQFRPLKGSDPFVGQEGLIETVAEFRVELVCDDKLIVDAVAALIAAHPYEEPAYDVIRLEVF